MTRLFVILRTVVLSVVLAWLGLEFAPDHNRDGDRPAPPSEQPEE